jgi:hypothetical protein
MKKLFGAVAFAIAAGCATGSAPPPPPPVPEWTEIPASVVQAFCARMQIDRVAADGDLAIVKTTQPLVLPGTMDALAQAAHKNTNAAAVAERVSAGQVTLPIAIPRGACKWMQIEWVDPSRDAGTMVVELSSPFANPFIRNEAAILARASLGGTNPTWYHIPLNRKGTEWTVGHIMPIGVWQ